MNSFTPDPVIVGIVIIIFITIQFFMQIACFYWWRYITGVPQSIVADGVASVAELAQSRIIPEPSPIISRSRSPDTPPANSPYLSRFGGSGGGGRVTDNFLSVPRSPALPVGDTSI